METIQKLTIKFRFNVYGGLKKNTSMQTNFTNFTFLIQIGHNVVIGHSCMICGQAGIGGSATLVACTIFFYSLYFTIPFEALNFMLLIHAELVITWFWLEKLVLLIMFL